MTADSAGVIHAPAKIWGSSKGRRITCECGAGLGPAWETVTDVLAEHVAEVEARRGAPDAAA